MNGDERRTFTSDLLPGKIVTGVHDLWKQPTGVQVDILSQAMERFDATTGLSLAMLGFNLRAGDLVVPDDEFHGSELSDRDVLTCAVMGNLEIFPWYALNAQSLGPHSLDSGIWDGVWGEAGNYFQQRNGGVGAAINPGDPDSVSEMWEGPLKFPRASYLREQHRFLNLTNAEPDDGVLVMLPSVAYLFGVWPAVKTHELDMRLETRSNVARWAVAAAVNSTALHKNYNGVVTAEATTFAHQQLILNTSSLPFQMAFSATNRPLERDAVLTFSGNWDLPLEKAAREFQDDPERKMLPKAVKRQRDEMARKYGGKR